MLPLSVLLKGDIMLQGNDPMKGFYDRLVASGDQQRMDIIRNIPIKLLMFMSWNDDITLESYKKHCIECGYGTKETMDILYPEN